MLRGRRKTEPQAQKCAEDGFELVRAEGPGRNVNYTIRSYTTEKPTGAIVLDRRVLNLGGKILLLRHCFVGRRFDGPFP